MSDNKLDVTIIQKPDQSYMVSITYIHLDRNKDKERRQMVSETTYRWNSQSKEIIDFLNLKRTKVFYSQVRAMCRYYGKREFRRY